MYVTSNYYYFPKWNVTKIYNIGSKRSFGIKIVSYLACQFHS